MVTPYLLSEIDHYLFRQEIDLPRKVLLPCSLLEILLL